MSPHNRQASDAANIFYLPAHPSRWQAFEQAVHGLLGRARGDALRIG
jgi:hypothetical protein